MSLTIDFKTNYALEKSIAFIGALLLVLPFSVEVANTIVLTVTYGHFMLAHYYQCKKSRPSKPVVTGILLILIAMLIFSHEFIVIASIAMIPLAFTHCLWDEFKLTGERGDMLGGMIVLTMVSVLATWLLDDRLFSQDLTPYLSIWIIISSFIILSFCLYLYGTKNLHLTTNTVLFSLAHALFVASYFQGIAPQGVIIYWIIIHHHGIGWYIHLSKKFYKSDKKKFRIFIQDVVLALSIFIGGYFLYKAWPDTLWFLEYLFYSISGIYAWSMLHYITTFQPVDYTNLIRLPRISA